MEGKDVPNLGQGTHGYVKKCTHLLSGKAYAVKVIRMEDEHYLGIKANFLYIKQLRHRAIIKYKALYLDRQNSLCHLLMECFPYPTLNDYKKILK